MVSGANVPAPAEDLLNENPSLVALGKKGHFGPGCLPARYSLWSPVASRRVFLCAPWFPARSPPTKGTKTVDFDAKTRLIFMIYLMYWI